MDPSWQPRTGAAQRRKGRRLRAAWRHDQQSIAQAVAVATHHSAIRRQKTATAEATNNALRSQTTSVAGDTEFSSLYEEELGGTRPDRLYEVRPQERVQRRTVEQNVDNSLFLPTLDVPVPQMENQLVEVCRLFDVLIPEQAIAVPKISSSRHSHRRRVRFAEQTAEQLVEVPTIISYSSLRGIVEQNVDIPVRRGRGRVGLGLHPGQSSTFGGAEFLPAATAEQNVDIPVPHGSRDLPPASSSSGLPGFQVVGGNFWARSQKSGGLGEGWDGALVMRQPTGAIGSISCPLCSCSSHLEPGTLFPCPCIWQSLFRASGCCLWLRILDFSGDDFFRGGNAWYNSGYMLCVSTSEAMDEFLHIFYVAADSDPEAFFSIRFEWRSMPSRCFWLQSCSARFAHGKLEVLAERHVTDSGDDGQHFSRSVRIFRTPR